jgi:hypothetical protein
MISASLFVFAGAMLTIMMSHDSLPDASILEKRVELVIRKIGHDLLLDAGDSTSRVLPIIKVSDQTYQLEFEKEFKFRSDSLIAITNRNFVAAGLETNHILGVIDRKTFQMIYGFEAREGKIGVNPCRGREQPAGNYAIQLTFTRPISEARNNEAVYFLITTILLVAAVAFVWPKTPVKKFDFDDTTGILKISGSNVELTHKESKLLKVLFANANQVIDRETLQNEVWKSEGVITSRSLDVFISKLRKKLGTDSGIRIVNIHGQGYKMIV